MLLHIALKDLKVIFKDKKALAIMLIMPAIIMLILGSALGGSFSSEPLVQKFPIGVVNKDDGPVSKVFIHQVLKDNMSEMFTTHIVSEEDANKMLDKKTIPAVIIIPENFSKNIDNNIPVKLEVRSEMESTVKASIVQSVAEGFAQNVSLGYAGAFAIRDQLSKYNIEIMKPVEGLSEALAIMGDLQAKLSASMVKYTEFNQERQKPMSGIQYYSAAMLVMFMLFGANMGTKLIVEERQAKTLGRIMSARASRFTLITGKFLGLLFICFVQSLILIIFTYFVYGVSWGNSLAALLLITFCSVFAGAGFGMLIASIAKTPKAADGIGMAFIQVSTILGGGMIPVYIMPDGMKQLAKATLNWWAMQGYSDLMLGKDLYTIVPYCGILIVMGAAYLGLGILKFRVE